FILAQKKAKVWIYSYISPKTGKRSTKNRIGSYPQMSLVEQSPQVFEQIARL
ncbi:TPA: DUF4102 domain-containing protein, partial [Mannheimia haemolytica]|nr:DUF4102 domain-containing protein [Mannheimia haemolytica]